ncbi:MAG: carboxylating nicotinate-nucleotide diphosphorylase [Chitinophagales bacterium]|nr:carboxylating nicotinate-nucleotide diphosphorylase [Chitinophagales bacterium]
MNVDEFIEAAILEDIGDPKEILKPGDHTSRATIRDETYDRARLLVKEDGVIAGVDLAQKIYQKIDPGVEIEVLIPDGEKVKYGDIVFHVEGEVKSILLGERLSLNFMQRMSGISTQTRRFVDEVEGTGVKILDTRKTTPLLRTFEKWAVRIGGGYNHRFGLYDMIMIKDNHIDYCGGITQAINSTKEYLKDLNLDIRIEVETRSIEDVKEVIGVGGIDRIMLDNFEPEEVEEAVTLIAGKFETEASGGIEFDTLRPYAMAGVDFISVGALTHSYESLDLSLKAF